MAEAEVTIRYKSTPAVLACVAFSATLPLAVIFSVWSLAVIGVSMSALKFGPTMIFLLLQFCGLISIGLGALVFADRTIFITRQGISLPFWMRPAARMRSQSSWSDVTEVMFNNGKVTLFFEKGRSVTISLKAMSANEANQFIVALEVWTGGAEKFPAIEDAKQYTEIACGGTGQRSYTEIWSEELTRRFGATNFIPLEPGNKIWSGRFTVERQMAFGGFSAIYLVRDQKHNEFILKEAVVPDDADTALKDEARRLFEREAALLSELKHKKIARVFDSFVENGRQYLILEYIPGQDLRQLVRKSGAQKEEFVLKWALDLAEVIAYLHNRPVPVVHRDISPDNLILDEKNVLHLIDFGAANLFLGTATGTMIGKQAYMAPEQFRGKANTKSDVYGFGCTMHFLLTGKDPEALTACRPTLLGAQTCRQLDDLIAACTDAADTQRPSISEVLTHLNVLVNMGSVA